MSTNTFNNPYYSSSVTKPDVRGYMNASIATQNPSVRGYATQSAQGGSGKNPWFGGAMEGAAAIGAGMGDIAGGIGAASQLSQSQSMPINHFNNMSFNVGQTEVGGVPSYAGIGNAQAKLGAIDADAATKGMGMKGFAGGAKAGAAIGGGVGAIAGVATAGITSAPLAAIGAGVGAVAGGLGGWIGGMTKKGKAAKAAWEAQQRGKAEVIAGQESYNQDVDSYFTGVDQNRGESQGERNYAQRMYGMNSYNDPFRSVV